MDPKHISLIKKAIRMLDYMRTDLVGILEEVAPSPSVAAKSSPLYAAFDLATQAKTAVPVTDDHGGHVADCPCWNCVSIRDGAKLMPRLTPDEAKAVQAGELNPFNPPPMALDVNPDDEGYEIGLEAPPPPVPLTPVITEYERRKREIHAQRGTVGAHGEVCNTKFAAAGVFCICAKCTAARA